MDAWAVAIFQRASYPWLTLSFDEPMPKKSTTGHLELQADTWERFERAVDVVAKSPPQHRKSREPIGKHRLTVAPSQVEGEGYGKKAENEGRDKENAKKSE
jgi:hypothetical protein